MALVAMVTPERVCWKGSLRRSHLEQPALSRTQAVMIDARE
jgi:hypothetical protein